MRIDSSGNVGIGTSSPSSYGKLAIVTTDSFPAIDIRADGRNYTTSSSYANYTLHNRSAIYAARGTNATPLTLNSGDYIYDQIFYGYDGTSFLGTAGILASTSGTVTTGSIPTSLVFSTGTSSATERMLIDASGNVGIGSSGTLTSASLFINKNVTGGTTAYGVDINGMIQSDVTALCVGFISAVNTAASAFTLPDLRHFYTGGAIIGSGSAVTSQYGFFVGSSLTGATNNYGFYSNIATGTNRWNFFAAGTASNYFAGPIGLATTGPVYGTHNLRIAVNGLTSADIISVLNEGQLPSTVTDSAVGIYSAITTSAAAFTLPVLNHFYAAPGTLGAGSTITSHIGFNAASTISTGTNNYGFYSNIASAANTYNFYATGTAVNYFAGSVGIGTTSPAVKLAISSTDAILVPVGTTAQRPTAATGYFRFNSSISRFEGYNGTGWGSLGGATGGGTDAVFYLNGQTVTTTYAIPSGQSAHSVGPITISSGVTVTVPSGSRWVIS